MKITRRQLRKVILNEISKGEELMRDTQNYPMKEVLHISQMLRSNEASYITMALTLAEDLGLVEPGWETFDLKPHYKVDGFRVTINHPTLGYHLSMYRDGQTYAVPLPKDHDTDTGEPADYPMTFELFPRFE